LSPSYGNVIYNITDPTAPEFVQYVRDDADIAPEGLTFIPGAESPSGDNLLIVTNEESSTLAIYASDAVEDDSPAVSLLDFEGFTAGTIITDQLAGVDISTSTEFGAMIFDTANITGGDSDLASETLGNVLILSEDGDASDPDDNARGGTFTFDFDGLVNVASVGLLDIEEDDGLITFYGEDNSVISTVAIDGLGDNSFQEISLGVEGVARMDIFLDGSGAIADIAYSFLEEAGLTADMATLL
jgi:hypothetical protein